MKYMKYIVIAVIAAIAGGLYFFYNRKSVQAPQFDHISNRNQIMDSIRRSLQTPSVDPKAISGVSIVESLSQAKPADGSRRGFTGFYKY